MLREVGHEDSNNEEAVGCLEWSFSVEAAGGLQAQGEVGVVDVAQLGTTFGKIGRQHGRGHKTGHG